MTTNTDFDTLIYLLEIIDHQEKIIESQSKAISDLSIKNTEYKTILENKV